jgi:hypothetical protein
MLAGIARNSQESDVKGMLAEVDSGDDGIHPMTGRMGMRRGRGLTFDVCTDDL